MYLGAIALTAGCNLALPWDSLPLRYLRIFGTAGGLGLAALTLRENRDLVRLDEVYYARQLARTKAASKLGDQDIDRLLNGLQGMMQQPAAAPTGYQPEEFDRAALLESATGIALLGNSGSGKTTLGQFLAQGLDAPMVVFDPHHDPDKNPWGDALVISDKDEILSGMEFLLSLLDRKDKRPLTVISDEHPASRMYAKSKDNDVVDRFTIRYGSEARKFGKLAIFMSQSGNTKALGLEGMGDFLENFALVRLQKVAVKHAKNNPDRELYAWLQSQAYALSIDGDRAMLHPNLGHHKRVQKGAVPVGLADIKSPALPGDIAGGLGVSPRFRGSVLNRSAPRLNPDIERLNRLLGKDCITSEPAEPFSLPVEPVVAELPSNHRAELVRLIRAGWSKARVTGEFFGAKKGGSKAYKAACFWYDEIKGETNQ
jgi:hypothetical protein